MKLAWYMLKGFVVGLLTAPIYALLYVYDMTYTFPREAMTYTFPREALKEGDDESEAK